MRCRLSLSRIKKRRLRLSQLLRRTLTWSRRIIKLRSLKRLPRWQIRLMTSRARRSQSSRRLMNPKSKPRRHLRSPMSKVKNPQLSKKRRKRTSQRLRSQSRLSNLKRKPQK